MNRETVATVVVTCNRKTLLHACLTSLLEQSHPLDGIYIVDNGSTDGTCAHLLAQGLIGPVAEDTGGPVESRRAVAPSCAARGEIDVHYVRMPENTGGAGGFHEGLRRAAAAGFDWLWLMDDDLRTAPDALDALMRKKNALAALPRRPFILNSLVLVGSQPEGDELAFPLQEFTAWGQPKRGVYHWRLSEVQDQARDGLYRWGCPFNGTFLPARVLEEIGLPNREFYIRGDERDFFWRAARKFDWYTVLDSRVFHPRPRAGVFDWKQYYLIRNSFVLNRYFDFTALRNLRLTVLSLARGLRHGRRGLTLVLRALGDGRAGRLGRRDDVHLGK